MPRAVTQAARVRAYGLTHALIAAAAFADADKKSHRHRLCLAISTTDDVDDKPGEPYLLVSAGGPTRVIAVNAGKALGADELRCDLSPAAAALIVKVFGASDGDVQLKYDGTRLTVAATDALFDNQKIEVRTLSFDKRADAPRIFATALELAEYDELLRVAITSDATVVVGKAAKALGAAPVIVPVTYHEVPAVAVRIGGQAVAFLRAATVTPDVAPVWRQLAAADLPEDGDAWYSDHIHLGHVLDGVAPLSVVKPGEVAGDVPEGQQEADVEPAVAEDTGVDLADVEADAALPERPVSLASVLADDDTVAGDAA